MPSTRILIGIAATIRGLEAGRVLWRILAPNVLSLPLIGWIPRPSQQVVPVIVTLWLALAIAFTLGYRVRLTGAALTVVMGYTLLLDQQSYSNHLYLLVLIVAVLALAPNPNLLLRFQLSVVYGFSALWKCNAYYLSGAILAVNLTPALYPWRQVQYMAPLAVGSVLAEAFLAFAFWKPRLRPIAWIVGLTLHVACIFIIGGLRVQIAVFALEMVALYTAFGPVPLRVSWQLPRRLRDHALSRSLLE